MRCHPARLGLPILLTLAACGPTGMGGDPAGVPANPRDAFDTRAVEVAETWRTVAGAAWHTGYVPLQDATVLVGDPKFTDDTKQAFGAGWYRDQIPLDTTRPATGTIRFPDGSLDVPLVSAAEAYRQIDQGDPPPCPGRPAAPAVPSPTGPDGAVGAPALSACIPLTVTAARLTTVPVRTSRGEARVPAWVFTVEELAAPVARLAVAPTAVTPVPTVSAPPGSADGLAAAQDLSAVDGARITYRLGVGACDTDVTPLVSESDDVVVVAGAVTRATGACTDQLLFKPVTATLHARLAARPVLDALTGRPLLLIPG